MKNDLSGLKSVIRDYHAKYMRSERSIQSASLAHKYYSIYRKAGGKMKFRDIVKGAK